MAREKVKKKAEKEDKGKKVGVKAEKEEKKEGIEADLKISRKKSDLLVPLEDYVRSGIHLGTKVITHDMREYVYRRRADGLAILNTNIINEKIKVASEFITQYDAKDIILVCKREAGWKAAELFSEVTGIRVFTKKYPAGIITNPSLKDFFETSLIIVCDPWLDKNAIHDASIVNILVIGLCDTNNLTRNLDIIIPCNNKAEKSIGLVLYLLSSAYTKKKNLKMSKKLSDFVPEEEAK